MRKVPTDKEADVQKIVFVYELHITTHISFRNERLSQKHKTFNTLMPRQNGRHFVGDILMILKRIFLNAKTFN